jgi:hypothetical protein
MSHAGAHAVLKGYSRGYSQGYSRGPHRVLTGTQAGTQRRSAAAGGLEGAIGHAGVGVRRAAPRALAEVELDLRSALYRHITYPMTMYSSVYMFIHYVDIQVYTWSYIYVYRKYLHLAP